MQPTFDEQAAASIQLIDRRSAGIQRAPINTDPLLAVMDKLANNPNLDADKIERLMNVFIDGHRKMETLTDEKAFSHAMADFYKNPPRIIKSRLAEMVKEGRKLYEYRFADLDAYATAAQEALGQRGITWSFPFSEAPNGVITVSCILRYGLYTHTPTTFSSPPDNTGGKNAIQAKASTLSYLERYTLCGATGLTAGMPDTDGKTTPAEAESRMDERQAADYMAAIEGSGSFDELQRNYFAAKDAADKAKDVTAAKEFAEMKNTMYKKLAKAVR